MENILNISARNETGKREVRKLRHTGFVPATIYGGQKAPQNVSVSQKALESVCYSSAFYNNIIECEIGSEKERILPRSVDFHPVTDKPIHVDFQRVSSDSKVRVHVAIEFINEDKSLGIKKGGVLNVVVHQLECICSADNIPGKISLDLSGKDIGDAFILDDIKLPVGVLAAHPERDHVIATLVGSRASISDEASSSNEQTES